MTVSVGGVKRFYPYIVIGKSTNSVEIVIGPFNGPDERPAIETILYENESISNVFWDLRYKKKKQ